MPSLVASTRDVRTECRNRASEVEALVPAGGPSLSVTSRLDFLEWPRTLGFAFVMVVSGLREERGRSKGVGASLLARVRVGRGI